MVVLGKKLDTSDNPNGPAYAVFAQQIPAALSFPYSMQRKVKKSLTSRVETRASIHAKSSVIEGDSYHLN